MRPIFKYDSAAAGAPICTASSAKQTYGSFSSASEYTATDEIPIARQVRIIRWAISPRLAIRIFLKDLFGIIKIIQTATVTLRNRTRMTRIGRILPDSTSCENGRDRESRAARERPPLRAIPVVSGRRRAALNTFLM